MSRRLTASVTTANSAPVPSAARIAGLNPCRTTLATTNGINATTMLDAPGRRREQHGQCPVKGRHPAVRQRAPTEIRTQTRCRDAATEDQPQTPV